MEMFDMTLVEFSQYVSELILNLRMSQYIAIFAFFLGLGLFFEAVWIYMSNS